MSKDIKTQYSEQTMKFIRSVAEKSGMTQEQVIDRVKNIFRGRAVFKHPIFS